MSDLRDSWMSCRQSHSRPRTVVLPTTRVGHHSPTLVPSRSTVSLRTCLLCVCVALCGVGGYVVVSNAVAPALRHGSVFAASVSTAVRDAIDQANREAERNANARLEARDRYISMRRASTAARPLETKSSLLLRLAALRRSDGSRVTLDEAAVDQLFPEWVTEQEHSWNEYAVLKDLVLAVSQISYSLALDAERA